MVATYAPGTVVILAGFMLLLCGNGLGATALLGLPIAAGGIALIWFGGRMRRDVVFRLNRGKVTFSCSLPAVEVVERFRQLLEREGDDSNRVRISPKYPPWVDERAFCFWVTVNGGKGGVSLKCSGEFHSAKKGEIAWYATFGPVRGITSCSFCQVLSLVQFSGQSAGWRRSVWNEALPWSSAEGSVRSCLPGCSQFVPHAAEFGRCWKRSFRPPRAPKCQSGCNSPAGCGRRLAEAEIREATVKEPPMLFAASIPVPGDFCHRVFCSHPLLVACRPTCLRRSSPPAVQSFGQDASVTSTGGAERCGTQRDTTRSRGDRPH